MQTWARNNRVSNENRGPCDFSVNLKFGEYCSTAYSTDIVERGCAHENIEFPRFLFRLKERTRLLSVDANLNISHGYSKKIFPVLHMMDLIEPDLHLRNQVGYFYL